jgi:site-specific DNA recombinase
VRAVLGMLRNRTYLGEVSFQGIHYPAPHEPLVDKDLFERVQEILGERSEDISLRRSNQSEYLLTGLVKCAHCGKRYLGASANGNGGRYRYYVCFSRQRYGKKACEGERLPADQLENAILDQLLAVLEREPMVRAAISEAFAELDADQPKREAELERIDAERRRTSESLERYFRAFEEGTMPESACAPRIGELSEKLRGLEARQEELAAEEPSEREPLTDEDLALLQAEVREVIEGGDPPTRKALLQSLVDEIRVVSRAEIFPSFSLPAVRPPQRAVTATEIRTPVSGLRIGSSKPFAVESGSTESEQFVPVPLSSVESGTNFGTKFGRPPPGVVSSERWTLSLTIDLPAPRCQRWSAIPYGILSP